MESKANYSLVGLISLLVFVLTAGFIYWFAVSDTQVATKRYNVIFEGTVTGLSSGTAVLFNGIRVGQVRRLNIDPDNPSRVIAHIEVEEGAPVKTDTNATLELQGLTGVSNIQLTGGSPDASNLEVASDEDVPTIMAGKSDLQTILEGVTETIDNANVAFGRLDTFFDENDEKAAATLSNIESFSAALSENADGIDSFLASMSEAGKEVGPLAADLQALSQRINTIVQDVDPAEVDAIVSDLSAFSNALAENSGKVETVFADASTVSANLRGSSERINALVERIDTVASSIDPDTVAQIVANIESVSTMLGENSEDFDTIVTNVTNASNRLGGITNDVETFSSRLASNSDALDTFFADATAVSGRLNSSSQQVTTVVDQVASVTGNVDPEAVSRIISNLDSVSSTLGENSENIQKFVSNLADASEKIGGITDDAARFANVLSENSAEIDTTLANAAEISDSLNTSSTRINAVVERIAAVTQNLDPEQVSKIVADIDSLSTVLGDNAENVDTFMTNMTEASSQLSDSVDRVDAILNQFDSMAGDADTQNLLAQLSSAAQSVQTLAENLDARTEVIASGLDRFSNQGLGEYRGLAVDARATLRRLDKVLTDLNRNPQSLVFGNGGGNVREYTKQ